jgi:oxygen-independent coproporphyrinogen III oxidase
VEVNPGTVSREKLSAYRKLGVNRLSIGIQSFHAAELQFLGRIHDADQAVRCVEDARAAGFDNLSIDLIYSLPDQTHDRWRRTLERAMELGPEHVSAYSLIVEDQTPLARMVAAGQVKTAPTDAEAGLYTMTMEFMERHGFEHYEVSNYARPGYRSRHNSAYWTHDNYIGLGPSAHSFWRAPDGRTARRWANIANLSIYLERLRKGDPATGFEETVSAGELVNERIFLGLRNDGLDLAGLQREYGVALRSIHGVVVDGLIEEGLALLREGVLRLTPRGFLLCDEIAGRLML